ncbi:MAG: methyltransferase [Kordia sp.]|nr:MAG: methyltransferase [Kordia sp.]
MFQVIAYIKFLFHSTNEHGVHSPFVFDLITKCFYNKKQLSVYQKLDKYRTELLKNKKNIQVTDFGAGSRVFKNNTRSISAIAYTAGITKKRSQLLTRLSQYFDFNTVLEFGTSLGLASVAIAFGNPKTKITTLEGCPETSRIAQEQFKEHQLNNITSIITDFSAFLKEEKSNYDLVYFDGNHQKEATLEYFNSLIDNTNNYSMFIFDDIHWSKGMEEAWEEIKTHPKVTITIDTFFWGFVFFRTETKHKEHFTIRA